MPRAPKQVLPIPPGATVADYPALAAQLDPAEGMADRIPAGGGKNVGWICDKGPDHQWKAPPRRRIANGAGCPCCNGKKPSVTHSLAARFPVIAAELDPAAPSTGGLTADQIIAGSHRRVGWRCSTCDHRWEAQVGPRTERGVGCPACAGSVVTDTDNLAAARPDVAVQWHPTRNGQLRPQDVRPGSSVRVWWLCPVHPDHEWRAAPSSRTKAVKPTGCPACAGHQLSASNNLAALHPAYAAQFDPALNDGRRADQVLAGTSEVITWRCDRGPDHVWRVSVVSRTSQDNGCPYCAGKRVSVTNMLARYPELVAEFDHEANAPDTPAALSESSRRLVWWRCPKGPDHRWRTRVSSRALHGHGCVCCAGHQMSVTNSLATRCPQAARDLDPALNDGLTAEQVTAGTTRVVTWSCPNGLGHTWRTTVASRVNALAAGHGDCPLCKPRQISQRQLAVASALAHALPGLRVDPRPEAIVTAGGRWRPDITVTELRLVLEYDGVFYHRDRGQHDARKSAELRFAGWTVVRMREHPLPPLGPDDLPVPVRPAAAADELVALLLAHLRAVLPPAARNLLDAALDRAAAAPAQPWQWQAPPGRFHTGLDLLAAFAAREGHACPTSEYEEDGFPLGRWLMAQRRLCRAGKLPQAQADLLAGVPGWIWDYQADRWGQFEEALLSYIAREGTARLPGVHVENGYPLGRKIATLRVQHRRGDLSRERAEQLESLPGWTWVIRRSRRTVAG
ncbi:zinc-ribbon domain-containing protein [Geodermatophilus sp. CPCC 205506]|uniref:zinc-ribbon domain-containing protein n=1 Tax=Geodermatophilus sp. CPCC 205506 TaxID=2936596 RepID=UPI003EEEF9F4